MGTVLSRLFVREAPISRLHHDILWYIFSLNSYAERITAEDTLDYVRYTSQVCRNWRKILLDSPSIWGNCINLDLLDQKSDSWRNLVLERTGKSQLSVTGGEVGILHPRHVVWKFLATLLNEHCSRIRHLDLRITFKDSSDCSDIWKMLRRPTETLKTLSIEGTGPWQKPHNFQLFSGHAPSLAKVSLPFPLAPSFHAPSVFTKNMRYLRLNEPLEFKNSDLLAACMQMPFLEVLALKLFKFNISPTLIEIISLPCLKLIKIESPNIDIYSALLRYISPSAGCALRVWHLLNPSSAPSMTGNIKDLECMRDVIARYAASFFAHHDCVSNVEDVQTIELDISLNYFEFTCCESRKDHFRIFVRLGRGPDVEAAPLEAMLLDLVSTFKLPTALTRLRLTCYSPLTDDFLRHEESSLLRVLHSLGSIIYLETSQHILSYLGNTAELDALFPLLEVVSLQSFSRCTETIEANVMPFLKRRLNTIPLKRLDITDSIFNCTPKDIRRLNKISGLEVVGGK